MGEIEVKGTKKLPKGKNYYYIQKRYSRYYVCSRCGYVFGYYYRGKWDFGKFYQKHRDKHGHKDFTIETDRTFPDECPECCYPFIDRLDYLQREANKGGLHG